MSGAGWAFFAFSCFLCGCACGVQIFYEAADFSYTFLYFYIRHVTHPRSRFF